MPDYVGCIAPRRDLKTRGKLAICTIVNIKVQFIYIQYIGDARTRHFKGDSGEVKLREEARVVALTDIFIS